MRAGNIYSCTTPINNKILCALNKKNIALQLQRVKCGMYIFKLRVTVDAIHLQIRLCFCFSSSTDIALFDVRGYIIFVWLLSYSEKDKFTLFVTVFVCWFLAQQHNQGLRMYCTCGGKLLFFWIGSFIDWMSNIQVKVTVPPKAFCIVSHFVLADIIYNYLLI